MGTKILRAIVVTLATAAALGGCFHRARSTLRIGDEVSPPAGLDSLATDKWIATQRAACPGRLRFFIDEMPMIDFDRVARYHSHIVAVQCAPRTP